MRRITRIAGVVGTAVAVAAIGSASLGGASSHREAPYTSTDAGIDATDLYAFVSPDSPDTVTFIANYIPGQDPASGPNFYKFGDDALYEINIDNDGDAVEDVSFQFDFTSNINPANAFNVNTFLYNTGPVESLTDADLNQRQYYSVSMFTGEGGAARTATVISGADNLQVAPANVGPTSFPNYDAVANQAVYTLSNGMKVFAGPRDDPFFIDLGGIFDLLNLGSGIDYLAGKNVHSIAIQVPIAMLTANGQTPTGPTDTNAILGVRTTAYRQGVSVLRPVGGAGSTRAQLAPGNVGEGTKQTRGPWVQLSRLGNPLVNEVAILLKDKDRFNGSKPKNDAQFLGYVDGTAPGSTPDAAPHIGALLELVKNIQTPAAPRSDLVAVFLTGVMGLNQPTGVVPSEQLRLNVMIKPGTTTISPLGVPGGDTQGYPNGRRLQDDIVDIGLSAVAGFLVDEDGNAATGGIEEGDLIQDGVNANDKPFSTSFPYLASPHDYADVAP